MENYIKVSKNKTGFPDPVKNDESLLNQELIDSVPEICNEYGLNGCFVDYRTDTQMPSAGYYLVASLSDELPKPENLYDMYMERCRNSSTHYLDYYIEKIDPDDITASILDMIEHCKTIEFLKTMFSEYNMPLPKKLKYNEINALMDSASSFNNEELSAGVRLMYKKNIKSFFKMEKRHSKSRFWTKWDNYYRSDKYVDVGSKFKNVIYFFLRKKPRVNMKRLWKLHAELSVIQYTKAEFKMFKEYMKIVHPEIPYAVAATQTFNNGEIKVPKGQEDNKELNPFGRSVTPEEYDQILFNCLTENRPIENIRIAKAEFVTIAYRKIDEPLMVSLYHKITLNYTKPCKYGDLVEKGNISLTLVPYNEFMNFASLAKSNGIPFAIDEGFFYKPLESSVAVMYNSYHDEMIKQIKGRIVSDLTMNSHHSATVKKDKQSLSEQIQQINLEQQNNKNKYKYKELTI